MNYAIMNDHLNIVKFLHENKREINYDETLLCAQDYYRKEIYTYLVNN